MEKREAKECTFCDRIWGVFGVATGALVFMIGMDLLSGGMISRMVGKPNARSTDSIDASEEYEEEYFDE